MTLSLRGVIIAATILIFVLAAVVEIRKGLRKRDEEVRGVTEWIESQAVEAERLRRLGLNTFKPESNVAFGESMVRDIRQGPSPVVGGLLRAIFDLCVLLPLGLIVTYLVAVVIQHPSRRRIGALTVRLGLPVLSVGVLLFVIWVVLMSRVLGSLAVPAG